ncbi:BON domain-containing protein [Sphingobacterium faecium]|uniref:BON domain-containing protein n=1 Tax=Sphingobacterium faecium TaxID=34087 RepID=UPI00320B8BE5
MKTDLQIQKDVIDEFKWNPSVNSSEIGVAVKDGVVTLSGQVDSYLKKVTAENLAKKVAGVKALAEDIQVGVSPSYKKTDAEIAAAVLNALKWNSFVQQERIKIEVEDGVVRLDGDVDWNFQRVAIKNAIENLQGVKTVLNYVTIKPQAVPSDIENRIARAFMRSATIDSRAVHAQVIGNKVILTGTVHSLAEKYDAASAAWAAPGIVSVENNLEIEIPKMAL